MTSIHPGAINAPPRPVAGVTIPDSRLAPEAIELVKDIEAPLLFHHSSDYQSASAAGVLLPKLMRLYRSRLLLAR
jgi:hypothetical protein